MNRAFGFAVGLVLLAAAPAAYVGSLYDEAATSCGSLVRPSPDPVCNVFEQRRWTMIAILVLGGLALMWIGRGGATERPPKKADVGMAAASGLLVIPVATVIIFLVAFLGFAVNGISQASTGLPDIFAPAALAIGAIVSATCAVRSGTDTGTDTGMALVAAAGALPFVFAVQAVSVALRWNIEDSPTPLRLAETFGGGLATGHDTAEFLTLALAALPVPFLLAWAAWSGRRMPTLPGALLLFLSVLIGGLLFEGRYGTLGGNVTFQWLPLVLLPTVAAVLAVLRYAVREPVAQAHAAESPLTG